MQDSNQYSRGRQATRALSRSVRTHRVDDRYKRPSAAAVFLAVVVVVVVEPSCGDARETMGRRETKAATTTARKRSAVAPSLSSSHKVTSRACWAWVLPPRACERDLGESAVPHPPWAAAAGRVVCRKRRSPPWCMPPAIRDSIPPWFCFFRSAMPKCTDRPGGRARGLLMGWFYLRHPSSSRRRTIRPPSGVECGVHFYIQGKCPIFLCFLVEMDFPPHTQKEKPTFSVVIVIMAVPYGLGATQEGMLVSGLALISLRNLLEKRFREKRARSI
jgi:hypothetical protein